jgi:hypothetical protein
MLHYAAKLRALGENAHAQVHSQCYNPGPSNFSFTLTPLAPAPASAPAPAPAPAPVVQPPSPIQVDPANVLLPTPSTPSTHTPDQPMHSPLPPTFCVPTPGPSQYHQLPIINHSISLRMQSILKSLQGEHISEHGRERPHHSASTSNVQDLCHALADMFGLPLLPISQPAPDRSPSPMAAIS